MASIVVLDNEKHKNMKVKPNPDLVHMKDQNMFSIALPEMSRVSNNFPAVFIKIPDTDRFRLVGLLGMNQGENLFYNKEQWLCSYAPMVILRHPFVIGPDDSGDPQKLTTCLEEGSEFLSEEEGNALFNEDGTETEYLKNIQTLLAELFRGEVQSQRFIQRMMEMDLISPFNVTVRTQSGKINNFTGLYSIDEKKLKELDKDVIHELHNSQYLPVIYMILSSIGQFNNLVKLKNKTASDPIVQLQIQSNDDSNPEQAANES